MNVDRILPYLIKGYENQKVKALQGMFTMQKVLHAF